MSESQKVENQKVAQQPNKKSKITSRFLVLFRETLAILFWVYVITKLFIFDIDIFLFEKLSPSYKWLLNYKFVILIGTIAVIWLMTKDKHILSWSLFVFFYPVILFLWRIPSFVFKKKSWNLAFALIDSIVSFFKSLKLTFITISFLLVSVVVILVFSNKILLWISMTLLTVILLFVYLQRIILVFKPSAIYQVYNKFFSGLGEFLRTNPQFALDENMKELLIDNMDKNQIQIWTAKVQQLVLFNRVCLFVAKKMKSYHDSRLNIVSSVLVILILVLYTVLTFTMINLGLFKINQHFFSFSNIPTFFNFFYYSFNNLFHSPIQEIIATTPISQLVRIIESIFALFLIGIFVWLVLSVRSQRDANELNDVIKNLTEEGIRVEGYIKDNYRLNNIEEAMQSLQKLHAAFIDFIYKITETIK